jgi:hypothetical protein
VSDLKLDPDLPRGGSAASGGSFYHLSFRSGSRGSGASAKSACDYITRTGEYEDPDRDPVVDTESGNLPSWAESDAGQFWEAADLFERANGRLYVSVDFALPRDLDLHEQIGLAREFAREFTASEKLSYTLSVHAGRDADGQEHNPHAHLMISERVNDGIERTREQWFRRANREHPERGGAPKSRTFHGREWVEQARGRWAELTNARLEHAERAELSRSETHDRLQTVADAVTEREQIATVDREITELEKLRRHLVDQIATEFDRNRGGGGGAGHGPDPSRDVDSSRGR